jgi:hypothetical protein
MISASVSTAALTLPATWGHNSLPVVHARQRLFTARSEGISPVVWVLRAVAMISLWQRTAASGSIDEAERRWIERLLSEEEG